MFASYLNKLQTVITAIKFEFHFKFLIYVLTTSRPACRVVRLKLSNELSTALIQSQIVCL